MQPPQQHPAAGSCPSTPPPSAPLCTRCYNNALLALSLLTSPPCPVKFASPEPFLSPPQQSWGTPSHVPTVSWVSPVVSDCVAQVHVQVHSPPPNPDTGSAEHVRWRRGWPAPSPTAQLPPVAQSGHSENRTETELEDCLRTPLSSLLLSSQGAFGGATGCRAASLTGVRSNAGSTPSCLCDPGKRPPP